jgi:hypothetical protein
MAQGTTGAGDARLEKKAHRGKPQQRTGRRSDWTQAKADKFIKVLADSCNVSLAARAISRSISNVYKQRTTNATFRAAWDQALAIGYARLEMMMLERALHGVEKAVKLSNGESKIMREYNDRVALALLRQHRDSVGAIETRLDDEDYQEACERIIEKLARLRERDLDVPPVERKGVPDRLRLIALAMRWRRTGDWPGTGDWPRKGKTRAR